MKNSFKIFYIVPELYPFAMTGDMALVANSFPKYIKNLGHDIRVMMPNYKTVNERKYVLRDVIRLQGLKIKTAEEVHTARSKSAFIPNSKVQVYFLDNKKYFDRDGLYGDINSDDLYNDTAERFIFFALGCLETLKLLYWQPDIIHCNDWQTALIPLLLKTLYKDDEFFKNTKTLLTVYNSNDIGEFSDKAFKSIGLEEKVVESQTKLLGAGKFSFLYSGLQYADMLSAGSSRDHTELAATLKKLGRNKDEVATIEPQIDTQLWNSEEDKLIPKTFNSKSLEGKAACKQALVEEYGLNFDANIPVFFTIINSERSINLQLFKNLLDSLLKLNIILLVGHTRKDEVFKILQEKSSNTDKFKVKLIGDEASIHKAVAGADVLLQVMNEQNGFVNSSICFAYGTIPFFGKEFNLKKFSENGYLSENSSPFSKSDTSDVIGIVKDLIKEYDSKEKWQQLVSKAMSKEFSWESSAQDYLKLYQKVTHSKNSNS